MKTGCRPLSFPRPGGRLWRPAHVQFRLHFAGCAELRRPGEKPVVDASHGLSQSRPVQHKRSGRGTDRLSVLSSPGRGCAFDSESAVVGRTDGRGLCSQSHCCLGGPGSFCVLQVVLWNGWLFTFFLANALGNVKIAYILGKSMRIPWR